MLSDYCIPVSSGIGLDVALFSHLIIIIIIIMVFIMRPASAISDSPFCNIII